MSVYIDADLLKAEFTGNFTKAYAVPLIKSIIDQQSTADVQEMKHGKWDEIRDGYGKLEGWIHKGCGRMSMGKDKYCPKCGARMDLEDK